jgi:hypothetical protein
MLVAPAGEDQDAAGGEGEECCEDRGPELRAGEGEIADGAWRR